MTENSEKYTHDDLKMDWKELSELFSKYPFSQKITGFMSVKAHYDHFFDMDNPGRKAFLQANNPGIQFANVLRDLETYKAAILINSQISVSQDHGQTITGQPTFDDPAGLSIIAETESREKISVKKPSVRGKTTIPIYQSDFTRWLMHQNVASPPNAIEENAKSPEREAKSNDPNQLREEIISEPLAALYAQQGLIKESIEMYMKLSLKIPDKSVYFAEIIKKLKKSN